MSDGRWRISVTAPDWGQDHLSSDAIVAFVDDELAHGPRERAVAHLAQCPQCAAQVVAQRQTRSALRAAHCPSLPSSLVQSLRSIPYSADLPAPPAGLALTPDGQFVSALRRRPMEPSRRMPTGRIRLGAGIAVSGLALGALAFGAPGASVEPSIPGPPAADRGALDTSLFGGGDLDGRNLDAQLRPVPTSVDAEPRDAGAGSIPGR